MDHQEIKRQDGAWGSRKLWYSVGTSCAVLLCGILAGFWTSFRPSLETVTGGLAGVLALYLGANAGTKHVLGRNAAALAAAVGPQEGDEPAEPKAPVEPLPPGHDL